MLKTVKVKKQLRLDELIEYAFDNDVKDTRFNSSNGAVIYFDKQGRFTLDDIFYVKKTSTFTVEVEEDITEDTKFETLLEINNAGELYHYKNTTISSMSGASSKYFHAIIDGKLQLIWEAE